MHLSLLLSLQNPGPALSGSYLVFRVSLLQIGWAPPPSFQSHKHITSDVCVCVCVIRMYMTQCNILKY